MNPPIDYWNVLFENELDGVTKRGPVPIYSKMDRLNSK